MSEDLIPYNPEEPSEEEKKWYQTILLILIVVIVLIAVVLTFGWFFKEEKRKREQAKEDKRQRLREVETLIRSLEGKKKKIEKNEKVIKILVRLGVGGLIAWLNYKYCLHYNVFPFDFEDDINKLLNLNAAIVTGYSFIAFISYGSIKNFVNRLKEILVKILSYVHMYSVEELNELIIERDRLKKELEEDN